MNERPPDDPLAEVIAAVREAEAACGRGDAEVAGPGLLLGASLLASLLSWAFRKSPLPTATLSLLASVLFMWAIAEWRARREATRRTSVILRSLEDVRARRTVTRRI